MYISFVNYLYLVRQAMVVFFEYRAVSYLAHFCTTNRSFCDVMSNISYTSGH